MTVKVHDEYNLVKDLVKEKEKKKSALMPLSEGSKLPWNGNIILSVIWLFLITRIALSVHLGGISHKFNDLGLKIRIWCRKLYANWYCLFLFGICQS